MAKRKRLTPANPMFIDTPAPSAPAMRAAPIADVAREASHVAAADELARTLTQAREEGRMVISVPLDAIEMDYLVRDRILRAAATPDEDMTALIESLRARGQQTPIELTELAPGRYGLISGWRRCTALRHLARKTADPRFGQVLALVRQPRDASDAYIAMVEENEIRVGLSYYERARIAARAVERGVFQTTKAALQALFQSASRPRRSKIGTFLTLVAQLDGHLRFPEAIPERLGLALARALQDDPRLANRIAITFHQHPPETAEDELRVLQAIVAQKTAKPGPAAPSAPVSGVAVSASQGKITLTGDAVTPELVTALKAWLAEQGL